MTRSVEAELPEPLVEERNREPSDEKRLVALSIHRTVRDLQFSGLFPKITPAGIVGGCLQPNGVLYVVGSNFASLPRLQKLGFVRRYRYALLHLKGGYHVHQLRSGGGRGGGAGEITGCFRCLHHLLDEAPPEVFRGQEIDVYVEDEVGLAAYDGHIPEQVARVLHSLLEGEVQRRLPSGCRGSGTREGGRGLVHQRPEVLRHMVLGKAEVKRHMVVNGLEAQIVVEQGSDGVEEVVVVGEDGDGHGTSPFLTHRYQVVQMIGRALRHQGDVTLPLRYRPVF